MMKFKALYSAMLFSLARPIRPCTPEGGERICFVSFPSPITW